MAHQMDSITLRITANATEAAQSLKKLQTSMNGLSSSASKLNSSLGSGAKGIASFAKSIGSAQKSMFSLGDGIKSVMLGIIGYHGALTALNWGKTTLKLGAAMTEIDHIIESVFAQDGVAAVNKWAKDAITQFGLAEQSAKQYAGTLSAMFQASGVTQKNAGKMATDLVGLAADLSSFFNVDTAEAFEKVRSGLSGMVRPLRSFGVDLSAASLKEFALAQGITKSYQEMTQAEKVMLRYQYLMSATSRQQGDFSRTSQSMANSLRTLKAYMSAIGTQLGVGLAAALRHVVVWMNTVASAALRAAQAFAIFMQTVFGKYKGGASGVAVESMADALEDAGDSVASGLGSGAASAAKIKKDLSVLPFDELNQLNKDSSSGGGGGGGGGGIGGDAFGDLEDLTDGIENSILPDAISRLGKAIANAFKAGDWQNLGELMGAGINAGVNKLNSIFTSENLNNRVKKWIQNIATTLNNMNKKINWSNIGQMLANGINTAFGWLNTAITSFDWATLGAGLGNAIRGFIDTIDAKEIGAYLGNKFQAILTGLNAALTAFGEKDAEGMTGWQRIGQKIAEGLKSINDTVDFKTLGEIASKLVNGLFDAIGQLATDLPWDDIGNNIIDGINTFISGTKWSENGKKFNAFMTNLSETLLKIARGVKWEEFGQGLADFLAEQDWKTWLWNLGEAIITALGGVIKGLITTPEGEFAVALIAGLNGISFVGKLAGMASNIIQAIIGTTVWKNFMNTGSPTGTGGTGGSGGGSNTPTVVGGGSGGKGTATETTEANPNDPGTIPGFNTLMNLALIGTWRGLEQQRQEVIQRSPENRSNKEKEAKESAQGMTYEQLKEIIPKKLMPEIATRFPDDKRESWYSYDEFLEKAQKNGMSAEEAYGIMYGDLSSRGWTQKWAVDRVEENRKKVEQIGDTAEYVAKELNKIPEDGIISVNSQLSKLGVTSNTTAKGAISVGSALSNLGLTSGTANKGISSVSSTLSDLGLTSQKTTNELGKSGEKGIKSYADKAFSKRNYLVNKMGSVQEAGLRKTNAILGIEGSGNSKVMEKVGEQSMGGTIQGWSNKASAFQTTVQTSISSAVENASKITGIFNKTGEDLGTEMDKGFKTGFGDAKPWVQKKVDSITGFINDNTNDKTNGLPAASKKLGSAGYAGFTTGFGTPSTYVSTQMKNTRDEMIVPGTQKYLSGAGNTAGSAITNGIYEKLPTGSSIAQKINDNTTADQKEGIIQKVGRFASTIGSAINQATSEKVTFSGEDAAWKMSDNSSGETKDTYIAQMKSKIMNKLGSAIGSGTSGAITYSGGDAAWKIQNNSASGTGRANLVSNANGIGSSIGKQIWPGLSPQLPSGNDIASKIKTNTENDATGKSNATSAGSIIGNWLASAIKNVHIPKPHISYTTSQKTILGVPVPWPTFSISWYKRGGLFMGGNGQMVGLAEGGKDEAVLPLENPRSMRMIADAIVGSNNFQGSMDEDKLADAIASRLIPYLGGGSGEKYIANEVYLNGEKIATAVSKAQRKRDNRFNPTPAIAY